MTGNLRRRRWTTTVAACLLWIVAAAGIAIAQRPAEGGRSARVRLSFDAEARRLGVDAELRRWVEDELPARLGLADVELAVHEQPHSLGDYNGRPPVANGPRAADRLPRVAPAPERRRQAGSPAGISCLFSAGARTDPSPVHRGGVRRGGRRPGRYVLLATRILALRQRVAAELTGSRVRFPRAHSRFPGHALTPTGVMAIRCKQFHLPDL